MSCPFSSVSPADALGGGCFKGENFKLLMARDSKNGRINFQEEDLIKLGLFGNFRKRNYFRNLRAGAEA